MDLSWKERKRKEYYGRYTTVEMKESIAKAGFGGTAVEEGYLLAVAPYVYEAINRIMDGDEEYLARYEIDDEEHRKEILWSLFQ